MDVHSKNDFSSGRVVISSKKMAHKSVVFNEVVENVMLCSLFGTLSPVYLREFHATLRSKLDTCDLQCVIIDLSNIDRIEPEAITELKNLHLFSKTAGVVLLICEYPKEDEVVLQKITVDNLSLLVVEKLKEAIRMVVT